MVSMDVDVFELDIISNQDSERTRREVLCITYQCHRRNMSFEEPTQSIKQEE